MEKDQYLSLYFLVSSGRKKPIATNIKEATDNPAEILRELQAPSPLSQFLDVKI
ncbi:hypothetical protein [Bacillus sp. FJAT-42315]|uniref:hypothetical protein n=1 Tax=Bacillus sp. FJAT-42315 TaxID=2014077 RepID=UPI001E5A4109|nr:hypothetical protein [Bacillus sp. FJAT-42315]